jgi:HEAT repeat protein
MDNLTSRIMKKLLIILLLIPGIIPLHTQDLRTIDTRVADLLARMPVNNLDDLEKQMQEMRALGREGRLQIIAMVQPPGEGDDTRARFAIESYSRYLSSYGHEEDRYEWENECIDAVYASGYPMVRSFFLSQLKYFGTKRSVEFAAGFLTDEEMCEPAMAVIASCDSPGKEDMLAMSLDIGTLPCPESVMNELARLKSDKATAQYISWYMRGDRDIRAAALNAMAESAHESVYITLMEAAREASYGWDETGATAALIQYARNLGDMGDVSNMEKICRELFSEADIQYKTAAMEALVHYMGYEAIDYLISGFREGGLEYRKAILDLSCDIPGKAATRKWMTLAAGVDDTRKAEIVKMLGERGDRLATDLVRKTLFCPSAPVRAASALALAQLEGREAVSELIDYIRSYQTDYDQVAGFRAFVTVLDSRKRDLIANALEGSGTRTKVTMLVLLSAGGENRFFDTVMKYTSSSEERLREVAFMELKYVAGPDNQEELIDLLLGTDDLSEIEHLQAAIVNAAMQINRAEDRVSAVAEAMKNSEQKEKLLPVLTEIGGQEALGILYEEFEKGDAETRSLVYEALVGWKDYSSSAVLFDICASGNKNYSERAFYDYINKVINASVLDRQKLQLLKKIEPYALREDQKIALDENYKMIEESIASEAVEEKTGGLNAYVLPEEEKAEGFVALFDGLTLDRWTGNKESYVVEDGCIVVRPDRGSGGNLFTLEEYGDFILRFEFQLTPGANNGLGIRAPLEGDAAYKGMELQILDNTAEIYSELEPYQYHGSVYGVIPAKRGFLKPVGEWNEQEVIVDGNTIKVILNGTIIVDGDISDAIKNGTMDKKDHPGLKRKTGHIGFLGHGSIVKFRSIRLKKI